MSAATMLPRLLMPRPAVLLGRIGILALLPVAAIMGFMPQGGLPHATLLLVMFVVLQTALSLALTHKSILAASFTFVQPGLRSGAAAAQAVWALTTGLLAAVAVSVLPVAGGAVFDPVAVFGLAVTLFGLPALIAFELPWSFQMPLWAFYLFFFSGPLGRAGVDGRLESWLGSPWPWLGSAAVVLTVLVLRVRSQALHRRLSGSCVLGPEDLWRQGRLQDFRAQRVRHHGTDGTLRWRSALLGRMVSRAERAAASGRPATARAWLLLQTGLANSISRRPRVVYFVSLAVVAMVLCGGYYDSRMVGRDLSGWFGGLAFSFAGLPLVGACHAMNSTVARLASRRDGLRSELRTLALAMPASAVLGAALYGVFAALSTVLPEITLGDGTYSFVVPRPHVMLLPPLLGPIMWLAVALRPRPESQLVAGLMAQAWLAGHAAMTFWPYRYSVPGWLAMVAAAGVVAYLLRRRWWAGGDQVV